VRSRSNFGSKTALSLQFWQENGADTTFLAISRRGAMLINDLAVRAKFPRRAPLAELDADVETNPDNYEGGRLRPLQELRPLRMPVHKGMQVYLTRNVRKDTDFVNGMKATVDRYHAPTQGLWVVTETGHRNVIWPWTDTDLGNHTYYPVRPGYASTVLKFQGAELRHATLFLDAANVPGAAYTAMSRVSYGNQCLIGGQVTRQHFMPAR
jgi:hypothetical protein